MRNNNKVKIPSLAGSDLSAWQSKENKIDCHAFSTKMFAMTKENTPTFANAKVSPLQEGNSLVYKPLN